MYIIIYMYNHNLICLINVLINMVWYHRCSFKIIQIVKSFYELINLMVKFLASDLSDLVKKFKTIVKNKFFLYFCVSTFVVSFYFSYFIILVLFFFVINLIHFSVFFFSRTPYSIRINLDIHNIINNKFFDQPNYFLIFINFFYYLPKIYAYYSFYNFLKFRQHRQDVFNMYLVTLIVVFPIRILIKVITTFSYITLKIAINITISSIPYFYFTVDSKWTYVQHILFNIYAEYYVSTYSYVIGCVIRINKDGTYTLNPH